VPAAAVIPAPIAYTKVVAVKKLVVETVSRGVGLPSAVRRARLRGFLPACSPPAAVWSVVERRRDRVRLQCGPSRLFTLNKLECSKRAIYRLNIACME
jgi:hypothetical protein